MDAANRLNRKAVRAAGRAEARRLAAALGVGPVGDVAGFLSFAEKARLIYVPEPLIQVQAKAIDERSYEVAVGQCYVAVNIIRAGIADAYECAVLDRVQGWHDALGLPLAQDPPAFRCPAAKGEPCRRVVTIARPGHIDQAGVAKTG